MAQDGTGPTISTHVLDTASGRPASGVHVTLSKLGDDGKPLRMTQALTDDDGRVRDLLERPLTAGVYRLEFSPGGRAAVERPGFGGAEDVGGDEGAGVAPPDERFFERVSVDFRVDDVSRSYHMPLLLGPFAISSYRGS